MTKGVGGSSAQEQLAELSPWSDTATPIGADEYQARLDKARGLAAAYGADAIVVGAGKSLQYFTGIGFGATERFVAMVLPTDGPLYFICPTFEIGSLTAATAIEGDMLGWEEHEDPFALTVTALQDQGYSKVAIDPDLSFHMAERLRKAARGLSFEDAAPLIDGCRMCKSPAEIALMQQAKSMTLEVHERTARILRPGMSTAEVRRFIDQAHRELGASGSSFCIVLFGTATSYPHGVPGEQTLEEDDLVLIDTGCTVGGYHSDITRTYVYGTPTDEHRRIWDLERAAQIAAFEAAELGAPCEAVDEAARSLITRAGLGPDYKLPGLPHRTGHGIGLAIHESPYLVPGDRTPLAVGMCFSNEPMIVVPERFGIRLEDHFHMTEEGPVWFTEPSPSLDAPFG